MGWGRRSSDIYGQAVGMWKLGRERKKGRGEQFKLLLIEMLAGTKVCIY